MQLQYLNGISTTNAPRFLYDSVQHQLLHTRADVDSVVGGFDLDNYQGLNTAADTEKIRAYLVRTKKIADQSPALIQSTRNLRRSPKCAPTSFSIGTPPSVNRQLS